MRLLVPSLGPGVAVDSTTQLCGRVCVGCPSLHSSTPAMPQLPWDLQHGWDYGTPPCIATTKLLPRQDITSCQSCSCKRGIEEEGPSVHIIRVQ